MWLVDVVDVCMLQSCLAVAGCRLTVVQLDGGGGGGAWRRRLTGWDDLYDVFHVLGGFLKRSLDGHISFIR